jgi:isoleucyl-tRNA synthetase
MTAVKEDLIRNNNTINWIPESIGKGRFGDWLENVQDWGISRNRYWGTPLNIWECSCGHQESIGSRQELAEAETRAMAPLRERLDALLAQIGQEYGYAFILNTDANAVPFINPVMGDDINQLVKDAFK